MTIYTLTHITMDTTKEISSTIQSNLLLFSDKYDIIFAELERNKELIYKHLEETQGRKNIKFNYFRTNNTQHLQSTYITAGPIVHILLVNTAEYTKPTTEIEFKPGDLVALKPEAVEAIKNMKYNLSSYNGPSENLLIAKIIKVSKQDKELEIMECALETSRPSDTYKMTNTCSAPMDFFRKITL